MGRKKELQQSPGQKREIKKALTTLRKREREAGREEGGGVDVCLSQPVCL